MGRKQAEEHVLKFIAKIAPGDENITLYRNMFKRMSNVEFDDWVKALGSEKTSLQIIAPNDGNVKLSVENNMKVAKELGFNFFQHIIVKGKEKNIKLPVKHMVIRLPFRRTAQLVSKKIAIPSDDKHIDLTTGQVTGDSKASKITMPEIQILTAMGVKDSIIELIKYRGGDTGGRVAMNALLTKQGSVSQKILEQYASGVSSTDVLHRFLVSLHYKSNLIYK